MADIYNALFGGQPANLEYIGYGDCPRCRYTRTLESIIKCYTGAIDFKLLHESAAPHWVDVLEG